MRVLLTSIGSRGDVQPLAVLAGRLRGAGHDVLLAIPPELRQLGDEVGVEVRPIGAGFAALARGQALPTHELGNPVAVWTTYTVLLREIVEGAAADTVAAAEGADVVVASGQQLLAATAAEKVGARYVYAALGPVALQSRSYPSVLGAGGPSNRVTHALSWRAARWMANTTLLAPINRARRGLGLPAVNDVLSHVVSGADHAVLLAASRHVVPAAADWGPHVVQTGFWLPEFVTYEPAAPLRTFLAAPGLPLVYLGFGTMPNRDPLRSLRTVLQAGRQAGVRLLLGGDWGGLGGEGGRDDRQALLVGDVPHAWLFPRVAAVVHHGGAGTTAAGLAASRPTLVVPHLGDQLHWGRLVHQLGVGPRPIARHALTADRLAAALADLVGNADRYGACAESIGVRLRAEDGPAEALPVVLGQTPERLHDT